MSKTKNKSRTEIEHLRGEIKRLKSQVRSLTRRNKELERKSHYYQDVVDEVVEDATIVDACTTCGKGKIKLLDLKHIVYKVCDICGEKEKI